MTTNHPTPVTESELEEIETRANAATRGPWYEEIVAGFVVAVQDESGGNDNVICQFWRKSDESDFIDAIRNRPFVAHARTDVPALCQTVRAAWAKYDAEDKDHRLTIDTFRRQEQIWQQKFDEQEKENTTLREQLAEVQFWKKQAEGWIAGVEERETAVCPEDTPFDDYIRTLESRLAQVEQELIETKQYHHDLIEELRQRP